MGHYKVETIEEMVQVALLMARVQHPTIREGLSATLRSMTGVEIKDFRQFVEEAARTL